MFGLTGKNALITGASGGIGGAIAKSLHAAGATVAISGTRRDPLEALANELCSHEQFTLEVSDLDFQFACPRRTTHKTCVLWLVEYAAAHVQVVAFILLLSLVYLFLY